MQQCLPKGLIDAVKDLRQGTVDDETYRAKLEARKHYRARPKSASDAEGHQRWLCPASDGASTVRCDLKSRSEVDDGKTKVRIRPTTTLREHRPTVCRQQSVMIDPERGAKFAQTLPYGDPEHERVYATLRNSVEGTNGFVKDWAFEGVGASQRRRIRGVAAQSLLVAFQLVAANFRKMDAYIKAVQRAAAGLFRRPRRRRTRSIADWNPQADIGGHRGPSPPTG